jgi:hypothetical protein
VSSTLTLFVWKEKSMHIRTDAVTITTALKRVKAGLVTSDYHSTSPYVVLDAQAGHITLSTWKKDYRIDATVAGEVMQEGSHAVPYEHLLQVTKALHGMITVRQKEIEVIISSDEAGRYTLPLQGEHVTKLQGCPHEVVVGMTYTKDVRDENRCSTCGHLTYDRVINLPGCQRHGTTGCS